MAQVGAVERATRSVTRPCGEGNTLTVRRHVTYPDSMVSLWLHTEQPTEYYRPDYHGRVFTIPEIVALVDRDGSPEDWSAALPSHVGSYVEAQAWNHQPLLAYKGDFRPG